MGYSLCSCCLLFLRNGRRLSFYKDAWSGEETFSISYPSLFALAANKEAFVAYVWESSREGGVGLLALLDLSMIGTWRRFKIYSKLYKIKKIFQAKMILCL